MMGESRLNSLLIFSKEYDLTINISFEDVRRNLEKDFLNIDAYDYNTM